MKISFRAIQLVAASVAISALLGACGGADPAYVDTTSFGTTATGQESIAARKWAEWKWYGTGRGPAGATATTESTPSTTTTSQDSTSTTTTIADSTTTTSQDSTTTTATTTNSTTTTTSQDSTTTTAPTTNSTTATTSTTTSTTAPAPAPAPAPSAVPTLSSVVPTKAFAEYTSGGNAQLLGTYPMLATISESGVSGPGSVLGNPLRFGKVKDPTGSGRTVFRHAMKSTDAPTAGADPCCQRVDVMPPNNGLQKETLYWIVWDMYLPSNTYFANDVTTLVNVHGGASVDNICGPVIQLSGGALNTIKCAAGQQYNSVYSLTSTPLADQWIKMAMRLRLSAGSTGLLQVFVNGTKKVDVAGPNTDPADGEYVKMAFYNWAWSYGIGDYSRPEREMFYGGLHIVKDSGYSVEQVSALLN